jgi:hypothetical protein
MPSIIKLYTVAAACAAISCPALAQSEPDEIDQYLAEFMKGVVVVRQVTDTHGQLISCVDIDHQPWTNNPSFAGPASASKNFRRRERQRSSEPWAPSSQLRLRSFVPRGASQ